MRITLPLQPTADDIAHLENDHSRRYTPHLLDPADPIRQRIIMERAVIRRAAQDLIAAGNWLRVFYGHDEGFGCARTDNVLTVMQAIGACDEEYLFVYPNSSDRRIAFAELVYGNDGWDVIADYAGRAEPLLDGSTILANELCEAVHA
jgi:hypothetical protein